MNCEICNKVLQENEKKLCQSCLAFIEYKYGSLEEFEKIRKGRYEK